MVNEKFKVLENKYIDLTNKYSNLECSHLKLKQDISILVQVIFLYHLLQLYLREHFQHFHNNKV